MSATTKRWSRRYHCLPSFVIGGAQKAATGSLAKWLEGHPYLKGGYGSNGHPGEVHYFDSFRNNASLTDLERTWRSYAERFPALSENESERACSRTKSPPVTYGSIKHLDYFPPFTVLCLDHHLRDPVDRAYSAFAHHIRHGRFGVIGDRVHTIRTARRVSRSPSALEGLALDSNKI